MVDPHVSPVTSLCNTAAPGSGVTVPTSLSSAGLAVAAVMVVVAVTAVVVMPIVVVTPIVVVGSREDAGWDRADSRGGPEAEGGARLPGCQLS